MPDHGFSVHTGKLRTEAGEWAQRKQGLRDALDLIDNGSGKGYKFGLLAQNANLDGEHDHFITAMVKAVNDAIATYDFIQHALLSAARDYDGSDATAAESQRSLEKRLP
jgi:hypothetical protein